MKNYAKNATPCILILKWLTKRHESSLMRFCYSKSLLIFSSAKVMLICIRENTYNAQADCECCICLSVIKTKINAKYDTKTIMVEQDAN